MQYDYTRNMGTRIACGSYVRRGDIVFDLFNGRIRKIKLPSWNLTRQAWGLIPEYFAPHTLYRNFAKAKAALIAALNDNLKAAVTDEQRTRILTEFDKALDLTENMIDYVEPYDEDENGLVVK